MPTQLTEKERRQQTFDDTDSPHPTHRLQIRDELISLANHFIDRWDEFADRETTSNQYGFNFVARQTEYLEQTLTISKAFIPGINIGHYHSYMAKYFELTP